MPPRKKTKDRSFRPAAGGAAISEGGAGACTASGAGGLAVPEGVLNMLDLRPRRNCRWRRREDGSIQLEVERFRRPWSRRLGHFFDLKPRRRVHLDRRGTAVWTLMDGKRTVAQIGELMEARFDEDDMTYPRLAEFMRLLETNGLILFQGEEGGKGEGRGAGAGTGSWSAQKRRKERGNSARDRRTAGGNRSRSARDRNTAGGNRSRSARDRRTAGGNRSRSARDRRTAARRGSGSPGGSGGRSGGRSR